MGPALIMYDGGPKWIPHFPIELEGRAQWIFYHLTGVTCLSRTEADGLILLPIILAITVMSYWWCGRR